MSTPNPISPAHKFVEGGLFYPTGHILAAFPGEAEARRAQKDFVSGGYSALQDCIYASPQDVIDDASADIRHTGFLAQLGHSLQTREAHLDLARKGCHFLTIHAPTRPEMERVIRVLSRVPVRYVIKYHLFVIENITARIPSAVTEEETA